MQTEVDEVMEEQLDTSGTIDPLDTIAKLTQEIESLKDANLRCMADIQNTQRRAAEDTKKAREYSISNFARELVSVKDYLEMALKDQSGNFDALKMGVDLTLKQLIQVFDSNKIKEIVPKCGDKLDPNVHQAMESIENNEFASNTIVEIMQKGYILNERVLRPAMVKVAK